MDNYGIRISKKDRDVLTAGTMDILYDPNMPTLKLFHEGSGSVAFNTDDGGFSVDILTGLEYDSDPLIFFYSQYYDSMDEILNPYYYLLPRYGTSMEPWYWSYYTEVVPDSDPTKKKLVFNGTYSAPMMGGESATINYYYYLYFDPFTE